MPSALKTLATLAGLALLTPVAAQSQLSLEARGSFTNPLGDLGDIADAGPGFGVDAIYNFNPAVSVYGGWSKDWYGCDACGEDEGIHSSGFEGGVKLLARREGRALPWGRVGVILHRLSVDGGAIDSESDYSLGFQVSAGLDIPLSPAFSLSPAIRYQSYGPDYDGADGDVDVSQLSLDLGLHLHVHAMGSN